MSLSIFGYIFFSLMVLLAINLLMTKSPKRRVEKEIKEEQPSEISIGKILFVVMLGMFTTILNQTTLNIALPTMMNDLNISTSTAQWLITGFMLVNGMLIPISAFLVSRFGFRKLFLIAMISFTIGSLVCAISHSFFLVMLGRILQAIGAGVLMPLGMNVFMTVFPPAKRGTAMGMMGIGMILAPAIGPTLSGWVVEHYQWNLMFYGMTVIGIIDMIFAFLWFKMPQKLNKDSFDVLGILFSSIGFGFLLYGFSEAGTDGWDSFIVLGSLIIGLLFIVLFSIRQLKTDKPLLNLNVLKYNTFTFTILINAIVTMSMFGAMLLLPVYLQNIRSFTPIQSGLLLLPGALVMGVMAPIAGWFFDKFGIRILAIVGLTVTTIATWEFTKLSMDTSYGFILGLYTLRSFGMSLIMMPIMTAGMNALPQKLIPHGTAMSNTMRQVAGSIGTAILVTIMTQQAAHHFTEYSNELTVQNQSAVQQTKQMSNMIASSTHLPSQSSDALAQQLLYAQAMKVSTIHGINDAFVFATIISIIALFLAFFLKTPKVSLIKDEQIQSDLKEPIDDVKSDK